MIQYYELPRYSPDVWQAVKAQMAPLRHKFMPSNVADNVAEKVELLREHRRQNFLRPETEPLMGLAIYGPSGAGKSKMVEKRVAPAMPETSDKRPKPFVSVRLEAPVRLKSAGFQLTRALLGDSHLRFNEKTNYWADMSGRLKDHGTVAVHWDEGQDIFLTANYREAMNIRSVFKAIMTYTMWPTILVLTGTPELKAHVEADPQVARRFFHVTLGEVLSNPGGKTIPDAVTKYCAAAGLNDGLSADSGYDVVGRLAHAAGYQFGMTFCRILDGIQEALAAGDKALKPIHLAHGFERASDFPPALNPFLADNWQALSPYRSVAPLPAPVRRSRAKAQPQHWVQP